MWIDKGLTLERETMLKIKQNCPNCKIVGYSRDDMSARHNQSPQFLKHIDLYDIFLLRNHMVFMN